MNPVTHLLSDLVAVNSINPKLVPNSPGESAIARFMESWLRSANLEVHLEEVQHRHCQRLR
jgi:acetylornithine deacetylase/succinyl-diaminopimelate desuccinylase-like protein